MKKMSDSIHLEPIILGNTNKLDFRVKEPSLIKTFPMMHYT